MRKFFVEEKNEMIEFSDEDIKHLKVIRLLKIGKEIKCYNQNGSEILVKIINLNPFKAIKVEMISEGKNHEPYNITCYMGVIKKNFFELVVEKLNELNIYKIIPVYFKYSQRNYILNYDRLNKIASESSKQCNRFKKIIIEEPIDFQKMIEKIKDHDVSFFCFENETSSNNLSNTQIHSKNKDISFIVGSEGGFSDEELEELKKTTISVRLTKTILKSETAAIYAASNIIERYFNEK